jgi:hypothetical protein
MAWYNSPAYRALIPLRLEGSEGHTVLVAGAQKPRTSFVLSRGPKNDAPQNPGTTASLVGCLKVEEIPDPVE